MRLCSLLNRSLLTTSILTLAVAWGGCSNGPPVGPPGPPVTPPSTTAVTEYPSGPATTGMGPLFIIAGPDHNLWFTNFQGNSVNFLDPTKPSGSNVTTYPLSLPNNNPTRIVVGPDGGLWFTETGPAEMSEPTPVTNNVARIATDGTPPVEFALPTTDSDPAGITLGPDGSLWFTETIANDVRRITAQGVISAPFPVPTVNGMPTSIVTGPDGNLWFAETAQNKIAMMTPAGVITEFTLPTANSGPADLVVGNDGKLWFTEGLTGKIGRMFIKASGAKNPGDFDAEWATPTPNSEPSGITVGPDCDIWFSEMNAGLIGRIDEAGVITEFTLPTKNSQPLGITLGPDDGNLWIAESAANQIAKLTPPVGSPTTCSTLSLPPVAKCQDVKVGTAPGTCKSAASVSIDNGSSDPNGQTLTSLLAPPAPYSLGNTGVSLTVSDTFAVSACSANVQVSDTENPVITCPAAAVAECTSPAGAVVTLTATATDNCPNLGTPACAGSGAPFMLGTTTTQCSVTDGSGNTSSCNAMVTVKDTTPPVISAVAANPATLAPNLAKDNVAVAVTVSDVCDPNVAQECKITSIGTNGFDFDVDYKITGPLTATLEAEWNLFSDRVYTLHVTCADASGNSAAGLAKVTVPNPWLAFLRRLFGGRH
jgi:virginiamycin B lyase